MLTPSKNLFNSSFQTPSQTHNFSHLKISPNYGKENHTNVDVHKTCYDLLPDENEAKQFVWKKKERRDRKRKHGGTGSTETRRDLVEERRQELDQLKRRRLERDRIHEQRMKEREDVNTLKLAGEFENWQKEEDAFMLRQARERTRLRLNAGRPQPIDLLVLYKENRRACNVADYPLHVVSRLGSSELEDVVADIKVVQEMGQEQECRYWEDVRTVAERYLQECRGERRESARRTGINHAVCCDVDKILSGKSSNQLIVLRGQIQQKLLSDSVDVSFWESVLDNLQFYLSYARLHEIQEQTARTKLKPTHSSSSNDSGRNNDTTTKHVDQSNEHTKCVPGHIQDDKPLVEDNNTVYECNPGEIIGHEADKMDVTSAQGAAIQSITKHYIRRSIDLYEEQYSPQYLKESELDNDVVITNPADDLKKLALARQQVRELYNRRRHSDDDDIDYNDERDFTDEYQLLRQCHSHDPSYRPRKPRYFNLVIAGFAWNRYNRTHYDKDNPPPKTVRGYKFCLFYPDLVDKTVTPVYSISPCPHQKDLDVIRFSAGPPYGDVAFKIVRGEWNRAVKRGYKCSFNGRVLELCFHFKHMCYRR